MQSEQTNNLPPQSRTSQQCGVAHHRVARWWQRRSAARLRERIAALKAECHVWVSAAEATCEKPDGSISGITVEQIATLKGQIARLETRLQIRETT